MKFALFILLFVSLCFSTIAQTQQQPDAAKIKYQLDKLNITGSVLYIAAHPDDENTRLIAYLTHEKKYRVGYLSLTRGDGGQNLIGNEQAEALGVIRTQELIAARNIDGAEQYFTRAYDFGYSKSPEETFKIWNKDSLLADVVWVIRNFKPDVIICRFPTTGEGGHGHHTASAILAEEAFTAAADKNKFPEQLNYTDVWQAKRLLWNTFKFGDRNITNESQFKIDVGSYNALLGKSYGEIAAHSRTQHSSQAFGTAMNRSSQIEYFKTLKGDAPQKTLLDGIDVSWLRFRNGQYYQKAIQQIIANYQYENPVASVSALCDLYLLIKQSKTIDATWQQVKLKEIQQLILACGGIWLEALSKNNFAAIKDSIEINFLAVNRSEVEVQLQKITTTNYSLPLDTFLKNIILFSLNKKLLVPNASVSQPYWLEKNHGKGFFNIQDINLINKAENDPSLLFSYTLNINGRIIDFPVKTQYKFVDPAKGEIYQPFIFTPNLTASFENEVYVFNQTNSKKITLKIKSFKNNVNTSISLLLPAGWKSIPEEQTVLLKEACNEQLISFEVLLPENKSDFERNSYNFYVLINGNEKAKSYENISYSHIPQQNLFFEANAKALVTNITKKKKLIGYIEGAGDKIPQALQQLDYEVHFLTANDITEKSLSTYETIITGVRTYNTLSDIKNIQAALMQYIEAGGTLIVQYNTTQKLLTEKLGPYPFKISRDRVTEEDAVVSVLLPNHAALNTPNKINADDFNNWIQERGLYFTSEADSKYDKLFSMNDSEEKSLDGSTLFTTYGKGKFIYTSLSFFRQLPAGVPGAYKLWVNFVEQ